MLVRSAALGRALLAAGTRGDVSVYRYAVQRELRTTASTTAAAVAARIGPAAATTHRHHGLTAIGTRGLHRNVIRGSDPVAVRLHRDHLVVQHPRWPVDDAFFSLVWLRDHCRCKRCYNYSTFQRETDVRQLAFDAHPLQYNVNSAGTVLEVIWHDGHQSEYTLRWLWENSYVGEKHRQQKQHRLWQRCLWDGWSPSTAEDLASVPHDSFMTTDKGLREIMKGFLTHGAAIVTGVAATLEATQAVIERVGVVQHTMFGGMWEFTSDGAYADTAYGTDELLPHTDGTYYSEPPGVQVFHCLGHDGTGGETSLVDGFAGLQRLFELDPGAYRLLSDTPCAGEYRDPARGLHLIGDGPVISHRGGVHVQPTPDHLLRLRFNPYDRAVARDLEPPQLDEFYRAYGRLTTLLWDEKRRRRLKLTPGAVLFIDNWRVLHGRSAFTGKRSMCGAYVARSDVMSRARSVGLLV